MAHTKITSASQLITLLQETPDEPQEFFINLGGIRSSKAIQLRPNGKSFYVHNEVDDTRQVLTPESLYTRSNIGKAMQTNNFYAY